MKLNQVKVPAIIAFTLTSFMVGIIVGILTIAAFGDQWGMLKSPGQTATGEGKSSEGGMPPGMGGGPAMPIGGPGAPPGGGGRGPNAKRQLASLVTKLDQLSRKPLSIKLDEEQRANLSRQLQGLDEKEELADEDAKKRLEAVLEIVKGEKDTLEAAGFRWPGQQRGNGRPPAVASNPFKEAENGKHLKALQEQLAQAKSN
jgi:hypothetical protein